MVKVELKFPVEIDGRKIEYVELRQPKIKDVKAMEKARARSGDFDAVVELVARLVDKPVTTIDEFHPLDFNEISEVATGFLEKPGSAPQAGGE